MKPHHGEIKTLSSEECNRLLERGRFGHLACHVKDDIYLVPITFSFEDGCLYSHSRPGKKIEMMRKNPRVCVQVQEFQDFFQWKSVIAWGNFEELQGSEAAIAMRQLIKKVVQKDPDQPRSELEVDLAVMFETSIIYRVQIERSTGRYEGAKIKTDLSG